MNPMLLQLLQALAQSGGLNQNTLGALQGMRQFVPQPTAQEHAPYYGSEDSRAQYFANIGRNPDGSQIQPTAPPPPMTSTPTANPQPRPGRRVYPQSPNWGGGLNGAMTSFNGGSPSPIVEPQRPRPELFGASPAPQVQARRR